MADFNLSFGLDIDGADPRDFFGGTLSYMSPEQLEVLARRRAANTLTPASDLYAFGILIWELATGEHPFGPLRRNQDREGIQRAVEQRRIASSPQLGPTFPHGLRVALERCLAFAPKDRTWTAGQVSRQLQIATIPAVHSLLFPATTSWEHRAARWPIAALTIAGLLPNLVIAPVNIIFNHTYLNLPMDLMFQHEIMVNGTLFPLATGILLYWARPLFDTLKNGESHLNSHAQVFAARRCLHITTISAVVILLFWALSGVIFPGLNYFRGAELTLTNFAMFLTSQLLHGTIAASVSYLMIAMISTRCLLPRILRDELPELSSAFDRLSAGVGAIMAILGLAAPISLMAVALFQLQSSPLLVSLGMFSALGYGVGLFLAPRIRATLYELRIAVSSTEHLLYRETKGWRPE